MKFKTLFISLLFLLSSSIGAAAKNIEGDYEHSIYTACSPTYENYTSKGCKVKEGLKIQRRNKSSFNLWIHTEADWGHFCSFRGVGHFENGVLMSKNIGCSVSIKLVGNVASVQAVGEHCSPSYCGANAYLDASGLKKKVRVIRHGVH
ncbi:hypothetical protein [Methylosoma difficile]